MLGCFRLINVDFYCRVQIKLCKMSELMLKRRDKSGPRLGYRLTLSSYQANTQANRLHARVNASNRSWNHYYFNQKIRYKADQTYRVFPVLSIVGVGAQGRRHFAEWVCVCERDVSGHNAPRQTATSHLRVSPYFKKQSVQKKKQQRQV